METEVYYAIQELITLINNTDFTKNLTVNLDLGVGMLGYILFTTLLAMLLGYEIGRKK